MSQQFTIKQRSVLRSRFIPKEEDQISVDFIDADSFSGSHLEDTLDALYVTSARSISTGTGLTGGGNLSTNRTISLNNDSIASLALADTALQPGDAATSAQGSLADTAVQPSRTIATGTGLTGGGDLSANRTIALNAASIASLALADTAIQAVPVLKLSTQTGITISTITIPSTPYTGSKIILFKNKLMLREGASDDFTISGATITLAVAAISGDIFDIYYMAT